ncbi:MAG: PIN domain-containing protein, partial [Zavarzinella sp.]|nr:PIN domain-containing protein [Zavarzinella sp.]
PPGRPRSLVKTAGSVTIRRVEPLGIVIDTNVFVSALRSRRGASFRLLELVGTGRFEIELSVPLALEYESVGRRMLPDTPLTEADFEAILDYVCQSARHRHVYYTWRPFLTDPGDDMVLELAVAAGGATIVTFNRDDFQGAERFGVRVCTPQAFLNEIGQGQA